MLASWQWLSAPVGMLTPPKSGGGDPHLGYLRTLEIGTRRVHPPTFRLGQWRGDMSTVPPLGPVPIRFRRIGSDGSRGSHGSVQAVRFEVQTVP